MREEGISTPRIRCTQREPLIGLTLLRVFLKNRIKENRRRNKELKKEGINIDGVGTLEGLVQKLCR